MPTFTRFETHDVRFPTSKHLDGSDAMNPDPDYSAAYRCAHRNVSLRFPGVQCACGDERENTRLSLDELI